MKKEWKSVLLITLFVLVLGVSMNVFAAGEATCTGVFADDFIQTMNKYVYVPIKWAVPILLTVFTSIDFAKIVFAGKKEEMDKAKNNFMKRFIAAIIIFFAPNIINLLVNFVNQQSINSCMNQFK